MKVKIIISVNPDISLKKKIRFLCDYSPKVDFKKDLTVQKQKANKRASKNE